MFPSVHILVEICLKSIKIEITKFFPLAISQHTQNMLTEIHFASKFCHIWDDGELCGLFYT